MKNIFFGHDLVTVENLSLSGVETVFHRADEMEKLVMSRGSDGRLRGKMLAALFYEPSSRTFSSFISAMQRLGGGFIPLHGMANTSVVKGETLEDTVRVFSSYADILVMRHSEPGSVTLAAKFADVPVINAGDGINEHPTQALTDLYTIKKEFGRLDNLKILMIGDLAHYRPTNSLAKLLTLFPAVSMNFATPKQVELPDTVRSFLKSRNIKFSEYNDFGHLIGETDILYVTRVKKEYMSPGLYSKIQGSYVIDKKMIAKMKKTSIILHCLPRVGEISTEVDDDPRAQYFSKQVRNGLYVRMALLDLIMRKE